MSCRWCGCKNKPSCQWTCIAKLTNGLFDDCGHAILDPAIDQIRSAEVVDQESVFLPTAMLFAFADHHGAVFAVGHDDLVNGRGRKPLEILAAKLAAAGHQRGDHAAEQ